MEHSATQPITRQSGVDVIDYWHGTAWHHRMAPACPPLRFPVCTCIGICILSVKVIMGKSDSVATTTNTAWRVAQQTNIRERSASAFSSPGNRFDPGRGGVVQKGGGRKEAKKITARS
jgi:hypothetical protein